MLSVEQAQQNGLAPFNFNFFWPFLHSSCPALKYTTTRTGRASFFPFLLLLLVDPYISPVIVLYSYKYRPLEKPPFPIEQQLLSHLPLIFPSSASKRSNFIHLPSPSLASPLGTVTKISRSPSLSLYLSLSIRKKR